MAYANMGSGHGYNPTPATMGSTTDANVEYARQMDLYRRSPDYEREMYERNLQTNEQRRRQYDSETARAGQERKYGVLSGLLGGGGFRVDGHGNSTRY